jgi:hypothetical protein
MTVFGGMSDVSSGPTQGASGSDASGPALSKLEKGEFVGVSRVSYSGAIKNAVLAARDAGYDIVNIDVAPPWMISVIDDGEVEFSAIVGIVYRIG